jgi:ubiquitin carboxyl-terminal hydrolase 7
MNKKKNDSISFYLDYAGPTDPKDWHACAQFALALSNPYDPTNYLVDSEF